MSISIIIPVYRVEEDIEACLESVIGQTCPGLEVILVDDCGGDASMEKAERLLARSALSWKSLRHKRNLGPSAARNAGAAAATGQFLFFLDADDILVSDALETLVALAERSGADVVAAAAFSLLPDGSRLTGGYGSISSEHESTRPLDDLYRGDLYTSPWNKLMNREFYQKNALSFVEGILYEDEPWTLELALAARKVCFTRRELYGYRSRPHSITHADRVHTLAATSSARQIQLLTALMEKYKLPADEGFSCWYLKRFIACVMRVFRCSELSRREKLTMLAEMFSRGYYPADNKLTEDKVIHVTNLLSALLPRHLAFYLAASAYALLKKCRLR